MLGQPLNAPLLALSITAPKPRWDSERIWRITLAVALLLTMAASFWGDWV